MYLSWFLSLHFFSELAALYIHVHCTHREIKIYFDGMAASLQWLMFFFSFFLKVSRNIDLVYGGGSIGLMGLISQAVFEGGRHVIG